MYLSAQYSTMILAIRFVEHQTDMFKLQASFRKIEKIWINRFGIGQRTTTSEIRNEQLDKYYRLDDTKSYEDNAAFLEIQF